MKHILFIFVCALFLAGCSTSDRMLKDEDSRIKSLGFPQQAETPSASTTPPPVTKKPMYQNPPSMQINPAKQYQATITTTKGVIVVALNAAATPNTVNNFVFLAKEGFYNETTFHRIIKDFMIQGGDPSGDGTGGPGYKFADEPFTGEYIRGTVAMANAGPNTNGSQFFIMHKDNALPKNYVIFGSVVSGLEVVDAIATAPVTAGRSGENSTPVEPVIVKTVTVEEK